jgi:hypothetical protein
MSHGVPRLSRDGVILEPKLHPVERAHVGDDLVSDLDHDLETDPGMTAGALAGISSRIRAFGVHWTVA